MTAEERMLCDALIVTVAGKSPISKEEFIRRFPSAVEDGKLASHMLMDVAKEQNARDLGCALVVGFTFGFAREQLELLCQLLDTSWHFSHENIVGLMQDFRAPNAVDALEKTALAHFGYLEYDESFGLSRKCTWALADIGTPAAREALTRLAASENSVIAAYAAKRLNRWQSELHRKGS